jgi:hypothetical protein
MNEMRRSLQITIVMLSLLPLAFGLLGLFSGATRFLPAGLNLPDLDSQYRFMSAWYLSLAILAWWIVPNIERHTALFTIICIGVFLGGLGRLIAWDHSGAPSTRFVVVLVAELLFPLLIVWQRRVASKAGNSRETAVTMEAAKK